MNFNFFKNKNNIKINPATEETLVNIKNDTADIDTKTATLVTNTANFATNAATVITPTANILPKKQASMANSMPVTVASDQTVNVFGEMKFANPSAAMAANAADPLFYLRRIVKQLEPRTTMDAAKRQRITVDSSNNIVITTTTVFSTIAGYDQRMWQYSSRNAFARGIRMRLIFS